MNNKLNNEENIYSFDFLIDRVYNLLENKKKNKIITIPSPLVQKFGGRKSIFTNCKDICDKLNRPVNHMFNIICSELSTQGSINGENQIILKGKFYSKHMNKVIISYINKYVKCNICDSLETIMEHEEGITFLNCNICLSKNAICL